MVGTEFPVHYRMLSSNPGLYTIDASCMENCGEKMYTVGQNRRLWERIKICRMKQGIVGDIGNSGKTMELWERIENCGLVHRIVGDKRLSGEKEDSGREQLYGRQRIEGESRIVGYFRELWESNRIGGENGELCNRTGNCGQAIVLWDKIENCWTIPGIMEDIGEKGTVEGNKEF